MKIYKHRIKKGAKLRMQELLRFPDCSSALMEGSLCAIVRFQNTSNILCKIDPGSTSVLYEVIVLDFDGDQTAFIDPDFLEEMEYSDWIYKNNKTPL